MVPLLGAFGPPLGGLKVVTSPYIGDAFTPPVPAHLLAYRGPYRARRVKRWRKLHPSYMKANGTYIIHRAAAMVFCHPDDLLRLKQAINTRTQ